MPESLTEQILELTRCMSELAAAGEWEASAKLAQQRQPLLERIVETGIEQDDLRKLIGVIQDADSQLASSAESARQQTVTELEEHRLRSRVAQIYAADI